MKTFCFCTIRLVFGTLYPAYSSYKAVKTKDVKEYVSIIAENQTAITYNIVSTIIISLFSVVFQVKWMMYWIIFALFTTVEVFTDMFLCW